VASKLKFDPPTVMNQQKEDTIVFGTLTRYDFLCSDARMLMDDCYMACATGPYGHPYPHPPNRKAQNAQGYIDTFCIDHGKSIEILHKRE